MKTIASTESRGHVTYYVEEEKWGPNTERRWLVRERRVVDGYIKSDNCVEVCDSERDAQRECNFLSGREARY